jgi:hypothetical protein
LRVTNQQTRAVAEYSRQPPADFKGEPSWVFASKQREGVNLGNHFPVQTSRSETGILSGGDGEGNLEIASDGQCVHDAFMPDESERLKKLEGDFAKALEESVNATLLCDRGHSRCVSEK